MWAPFHAGEGGPQRDEEEVIEFGDTATDDDDFRIQGADQTGEVSG